MKAHERTRLEVLRHGAHGHAYLRVVYEQHQQHDQHQRQHRRHQRDHLSRRAEDADRVGYPGDGGIVLVQAAGDVEREVLQKIAHAYGAYHYRHPRRGAQGLIRHALYEEAQQHCEHYYKRYRQPQRHPGNGIDHHEARDHEHVAVGEVYEPEYAVDHSIADGYERVLTADGYAGEQIRQQLFKEIHRVTSYCLRRLENAAFRRTFDGAHARFRESRGKAGAFAPARRFFLLQVCSRGALIQRPARR